MPDNLSCDLQQNRLHLPDCRAHTVFKGEHVLQTSKPPDLNMQKNNKILGLENGTPQLNIIESIQTIKRNHASFLSLSWSVSFLFSDGSCMSKSES